MLGANAGSNVGATTTVATSCGSGGNNSDVWWVFTSTELCTATYQFDTNGSVLSDTVMGLWDACGGTELECDDDDGDGLRSLIQYDLDPGQTVWISVQDWASSVSQNDITLNVTLVAGPATGACCLEDATCMDGLNQCECEDVGGVYQGDDVLCDGGAIPPLTFFRCDSPFEDISGTGTAGPAGDDVGLLVPLGFAFNFYAVNHTDITISTNGYLTFGPDGTDFSNDPIPNTTDPNDLIAPFWDDYRTSDGGEIHYQTLGSSPNRRFIAQWTAIAEFATPSDTATFQAVLYEGSNCIEFRYGPLVGIPSSAGDVTIGIEDPAGTSGVALDAATIAEGDCWRICPQEVPIPPVDCIGRCCFGNPAAPSCDEISESACSAPRRLLECRPRLQRPLPAGLRTLLHP